MSLAVGLVATAAACGSSGGTTTVTQSAGGGGDSNSKVLVGAGSTFVAPLVAQWEADYVKSPAAVTITYGAIGSGGGVDQITARTVDFGASDAPLSSDQATACKGCIQIPWSLGAVAITYNVKGLQNKIHLTGPVIADMFMGKITSWNDPEIAKLNPGVSLPDTHITPVYRSDGSGTSFAFTDWLTKVSPDWSNSVGTSTQPPFPTGTGAEHSSGVVAAVQATDGAVTYVDLAYVQANDLQYALLQNAAGNYPEPGTKSVIAAANVGTTNPDGSISLVNPPASAADAYPDATFTYVIVPQDSPKASTLKAFLQYAIGPTGQAFGPDLGYPKLPSSIVASDQALINKIGS
ncbi:MAG: phosphate ABC transporter substrate-binding protein PstS [Gaiellales bacterium]